MSNNIVRTLGGQRVGSGNNMKVRMNNFERSSHNMSRVWKSSLTVGTLIPCFREVALPGDSFDIDIESLVKTQATSAPLFGSFKMQVDFYMCPMRLYNAALHNNTLGVGLKMSEIKFTRFVAESHGNKAGEYASSLNAYLGQRYKKPSQEYNLMPHLAYYDIFKNYYANKQEKKAYVIHNLLINFSYVDAGDGDATQVYYRGGWHKGNEPSPTFEKNFKIGFAFNNVDGHSLDEIKEVFSNTSNWQTFSFLTSTEQTKVVNPATLNDLKQRGIISIGAQAGPNVMVYWNINNKDEWNNYFNLSGSFTLNYVRGIVADTDVNAYGSAPHMNEFDIDNIDRMREQILSAGKNNIRYTSSGQMWLPYRVNVDNKLKSELAGIVTKTYLSDIFNNWLNSETIIGSNGIAAITAIDTSSGSFTIDSLILANKVYNMLNRIAVSGGSYEDWQEVVYGEKVNFRAETPIYLGGMSREIYFEEVVSTADSTAEGSEVPLGSLAGKGEQGDKKGGKLSFRVNEPSLIMGIVSLTPRIDYSQGNWWFNNLLSMDDLHKPSLDGIGFQDLMCDSMVGGAKGAVGKQPAWLNYMTSFNENFGDFASGGSLEHMVLNRNYNAIIKSDDSWEIKDITTYIDPTKFNYIFADDNLTAQNFWVQLGFNVLARRKMSAKIMPNL